MKVDEEQVYSYIFDTDNFFFMFLSLDFKMRSIGLKRVLRCLLLPILSFSAIPGRISRIFNPGKEGNSTNFFRGRLRS